jgi:hypothetical protein
VPEYVLAQYGLTTKDKLEFRPDGRASYLVLHFTGANGILREVEITGTIRGTSPGSAGGGATLTFKAGDEELSFAGSIKATHTKDGRRKRPPDHAHNTDSVSAAPISSEAW